MSLGRLRIMHIGGIGMTPEERALRDAFLAECWAPVREYHDGDPLPKRRTRRRAESVHKPVDRARKGAA